VIQSRLVSLTTVAPESETAAAESAKSHATPKSIALVFLCTVIGAAAQILMKQGANHLTGAGLLGIITNLPLLAGYLCYGVNTVLLVMALRQGHLSVLYPIIALTYVWVTILSPMFFVDHINVFKGTGVGLIVLGVSLIGVGSRS
jgi:multidrug transporter EmrE-like cation transporter